MVQTQNSLYFNIFNAMCPFHGVILFYKNTETFVLCSQLKQKIRSAIMCIITYLPFLPKCPEFTQTHVHWVGDAIQPSHPLSSPSPPAPDWCPPSIRVFSNESTLCITSKNFSIKKKNKCLKTIIPTSKHDTFQSISHLPGSSAGLHPWAAPCRASCLAVSKLLSCV